MPLLIIRNDITKMQVDAVVNPSNSMLQCGRGTSQAIFNEAGAKVLAGALAEIGECSEGEAVITKGFNLPAKYIIHAVCPKWRGKDAETYELLGRSYTSALMLAKQYALKTVAFPLLSSGFYGWPKAEALHEATAAISRFLLAEDMTVYIVLYDHESVEIGKKLFSSVKEYIDEHYIEQKRRQYEYPAYQTLQSSMAAPASHGNLLQKMSPVKERKLEDLIAQMDETFSQKLLRLIDERGMKDSEVYRKANIDRRLFSKIRNDVYYTPSKKTVLAFAIALELSFDETKDLLMKAGFALSYSSKFDIILSFFIENGQYDVFLINEVLFAYGQPLLGE